MRSKKILMFLFTIVIVLMVLSIYQLLKADWYAKNYETYAKADLNLRFRRILSKKNIQLEFYREMDSFLKKNPAYRAVFLFTAASDNKKKVAWSIPLRLEDIEVKDDFIRGILKIMDGGVYKRVELVNLAFTEKQFKNAYTHLPDMTIHQIVREEKLIKDSYPYYREAQLVLLYSLIFFCILVTIYIYIEAKSTHRSAILWALFALLTNFIAVIIYYLSSPKDIRKCIHCNGKVHKDFKLCPHCGEKLKHFCPNCRHLLEANWHFCPECGDEI